MNILIIRLGSMGDIVMTTALLRMLHLQLGARIIYVTKQEYVTIIEHNPHIDKVIPYSGDVPSTVTLIRREKINLLIDLQKNLSSLRIRMLLGLRTVAYDKRTVDKFRILTCRNKRIHLTSVVERYIEAMQTYGVVNDGLGLEYYFPPTMSQHSLVRPSQRSSLAIVAGGTYATKRIPTHLILQLADLDTWDIYLLGGSDTDVALTRVGGDHIYNGINRLSWHQSASILRDVDIVVAGDTGLMHVSAALQKPLVVVWGSTAPRLGFAPYYGVSSDKRHIDVAQEMSCRPCSKYGRPDCPLGHMNCLNTIKSQDIIDAIEELLR